MFENVERMSEIIITNLSFLFFFVDRDRGSMEQVDRKRDNLKLRIGLNYETEVGLLSGLPI